jgi:hypothetical protein
VRFLTLPPFKRAFKLSLLFERVFEPSLPSERAFEPSLPYERAFKPSLPFERTFKPSTILLSAPSSPHLLRVRLWALDHPFKCAFEPSFSFFFYLCRSPITMKLFLCIFFSTWVGHPLQWDHFKKHLSVFSPSPGTIRSFFLKKKPKKNQSKKKRKQKGKRGRVFTIILLYKIYYTKSKENKFSNAFAP